MNTLMNMNPWSFLDEMLNANSRAFKSIQARAAGRFPPVNVLMDDDAIIIDVELPGKTARDVSLELEPQAVTISDAVAKAEGEAKEGEKAECAEAECRWRRRLELPFRVNAEKANAKFTNGILRIELPKADAATKRRIAIAE